MLTCSQHAVQKLLTQTHFISCFCFLFLNTLRCYSKLLHKADFHFKCASPKNHKRWCIAPTGTMTSSVVCDVMDVDCKHAVV